MYSFEKLKLDQFQKSAIESKNLIQSVGGAGPSKSWDVYTTNDSEGRPVSKDARVTDYCVDF